MIRLEITIMKYFHRGSAKVSALSSSRINKCEYLTVEEILPSNQKKKNKTG